MSTAVFTLIASGVTQLPLFGVVLTPGSPTGTVQLADILYSYRMTFSNIAPISTITGSEYANLALALDRSQVSVFVSPNTFTTSAQLKTYLDSLIASSVSVTGGIPQAWTQPAWEIDSILGSDTNTGGPGKPLKTFTEFMNRVGTVYEPQQISSIEIVEDLLPTDIPIITMVSGKGRLYITGRKKVKRTGTLQNQRVLAPATNTPMGIKDGLSSTWLPSRGLALGDSASGQLGSQGLVGITSGVNAGGFFWPAKDEGLGVARCSVGGLPVAGDDLNEDFLQPIVNGTTFEQYRLPIIPRLQISTMISPGLKDASTNSPGITFQFLQLLDTDPGFLFDNVFYGQNEVNFRECVLAGSVVAAEGYMNVINSCADTHSFGALGSGHLYVAQCLIQGALMIAGGQGVIESGRYTLFQGCTSAMVGDHVVMTTHTRGWSVFDSPATFLDYSESSLGGCYGPLWGTGNTGYGLKIGSGSQLVHDGSAKTIIAAAGDMLIANRTAIPAYNPATDTWTAPRNLTFVNLAAAVGAGGFGGDASYPAKLCGIVQI